MMKQSFSYHLEQFDTDQKRLCPPKRFKFQHQPGPSFDISIILFHQIIQVFTLSDCHPLVIGVVGVECTVNTRPLPQKISNGRFLVKLKRQ